MSLRILDQNSKLSPEFAQSEGDVIVSSYLRHFLLAISKRLQEVWSLFRYHQILMWSGGHLSSLWLWQGFLKTSVLPPGIKRAILTMLCWRKECDLGGDHHPSIQPAFGMQEEHPKRVYIPTGKINTSSVECKCRIHLLPIPGLWQQPMDHGVLSVWRLDKNSIEICSL